MLTSPVSYGAQLGQCTWFNKPAITTQQGVVEGENYALHSESFGQYLVHRNCSAYQSPLSKESPRRRVAASVARSRIYGALDLCLGNGGSAQSQTWLQRWRCEWKIGLKWGSLTTMRSRSTCKGFGWQGRLAKVMEKRKGEEEGESAPGWHLMPPTE